MTLSIKSHYDEKRLAVKEFHNKLITTAAILIVLAGCFGVAIAVVISTMYGSTIFTSPISSSSSSEEIASIPIPAIDLGSVNGFVMGSDGSPVAGASVLVYKHMGLIDSVDKNAGYSTSVMTKSDGAYLFDSLPSGVYKLIVTHPNGIVQTIDNYAVWPSSSSSYVFKE